MRKKIDVKHGALAHIYVLDREICEHKKDEELRCYKLLKMFFFILLKKIIDKSFNNVAQTK